MKALSLIQSSPAQTPSLSLTELPTPLPNQGQLLIKIRATSIQHSDIVNSYGGFLQTTFPRVPGRDHAGVVVAGGDPKLKGQEVYGTSGPELSFTHDGAHAEFCVVNEDAVARKPKSLTWAQAASVGGYYTTARRALARANVTGSDAVLVLGATGRVGSAVTQMARSRGCRVATASRRDSTDISLLKDPQLSTVVSVLGKEPDVVIDAVGNLRITRAALDRIAVKGRMVCIAAPCTGSTELPVDIKALFRKNISLLGFTSLLLSARETAESLEEMAGMFDRGELTCWADDAILKVGLEGALDVYEGKVKGAHVVIEM